MRLPILLPVWLLAALTLQGAVVAGRLIDPQGKPVAGARLNTTPSRETVTTQDGKFWFSGVPAGTYNLSADAPGFDEVPRTVTVTGDAPVQIDLQFDGLAVRSDAMTVTADVKDTDIEQPDPAQRVLVREEILDANPGRPGAPVSIPGLPVETASSGIKAPQYFAPGVAGDHGEPIAQFIQVGSYLVSNNLSANAHGNGYADPNILVPEVIGSVQVDGGAFNVREGNHSQNLSTTYGLRTQIDPFFTLTGDYRDLDLVTGFRPNAHSWFLAQASYGNGFLDRLSHSAKT